MERIFSKIARQAGVGAETSLLLGVSGGVDSMVLLDLLCRFMGDGGHYLQIVHVDHQIRAKSDEDADFVLNQCRELGIPCQVERVDVPALAIEKGLSLETAGREARRKLFLGQAEAAGCMHIVLAHHRDDQAETFLQRLLRGSGKSGLAGMSEIQGLWWRPLLRFSRQEIMAYAEQRKLRWVEDESNADTVYLRNRIRHQLLPQLSDYNPEIKQRLASLSRQFQLEEDFWQQQVAQCWAKVLVNNEDGLRLNRQALLDAHPALQVRLLREGLRQVRGDLSGIATVHLDALSRLLHTERSQAELDLPGSWAGRRYEQLWLRKSKPERLSFDLLLSLGKPLSLPDGRVLYAELSGQAVSETAVQVVFDPSALEFPLQVRSPEAGDRFRPSGMRGQRKLKNFMIDLKLEKEQRQSFPLLLDRGEILWLIGLRRSALAPLESNSRKMLVLRLLEAADLPTIAL
ncbi:tRNA lysidine(34) synthetase TilS [Geopsychrobacter electrodiphilus]|uniref:tRNA lysidine(34) synthetase TilS n=1 Tax=Geopsychrobacter electrodiphilus TaxID=225196 RepID=UPI00036831EB|nr:tRNA lysidine(34) synthetase TilS [Geopsychrobacter electrodiphilus]